METLTDEVVAPGAPVEREVTRRDLLVGAIHGIWALIAAALCLPASAYLLLGAKPRRRDEWTEVGDVTKLPTGQPVEVAFRRNRTDGWRVGSEKLTAWVVKTSSRSVVAFGAQCTHLGCAHHWDEGKSKFICPCHNSLFSMEGKVLAGPAPRPLDRYELKIEGDKLLLGSLHKNAKDSV